MKFKTVGAKSTMIALDENGKKVWYHTYQKVYDGAKQYLREGDEVEISLAEEEKAGLKVITFIKKVGQTTTPKEQPTDSNAPKCEVCGKVLKDAKYTLCYTCNQKAANDTAVKNFSDDAPKCTVCGKIMKDSKYSVCYACNQKEPYKTETPSSKSTSIEKQNANKCTSNALIGLQGQYGLNEICDIIDTLWDKFYEKLK